MEKFIDETKENRLISLVVHHLRRKEYFNFGEGETIVVFIYKMEARPFNIYY